MKKTAIELFAGVGGFRVGLNDVTLNKSGKTVEKDNFEFVWGNQWEPSTKIQPAFDCYKLRFSKGNDDNEFSNEDITKVDTKKIPDFTLLTGGFPCQDYSVARSLSQEKGIEGKKGVLWWEINKIIKAKKPPFVLLENVDRLLRSPSVQRGRDFAIMLKCFSDNNYSVEWRVINAADYGHPQKRRRVFIFAFKNSTNLFKKNSKNTKENILVKDGLFAKTFPIEDKITIRETELNSELIDISDNFTFHFEKSGYMSKNKIYTAKTTPITQPIYPLKKILESGVVDTIHFVTAAKEKKFLTLKGSKKIERVSKDGFKYTYSEGKMNYPDSLELPGRTMLTSEGTVNRSSHVVLDRNAATKRFLTPIECERLNQFPDNWTNTMPIRNRYFMMGNSLVTGIVSKLGKIISEYIDEEE